MISTVTLKGHNISRVYYENCKSPITRAAHQIICGFHPTRPGERDEVALIGKVASIIREFKRDDYKPLLAKDPNAACDMYFHNLINPIMDVIYQGACTDDEVIEGVMQEVTKILKEHLNIPDPLALGV